LIFSKKQKSKVLNREKIRIKIMLPIRNIERDIEEVIRKLEISEKDREKLGNATAGIVARLLPAFEREICLENMLLASTYLASRKAGIPLNPLQINKAYSTNNSSWLPLLDRFYSEIEGL
jgi:hypothetical protein